LVTAILIPIICIYFYWVTKNDMKENEKKWLSLTDLQEEAIVTGKVLQIVHSNKRFYYHRYIHIIEISLQTEMNTIHVKRITPYNNQLEPFPIKIGDQVRLFGNWQENEFRFMRYDILSQNQKELF
jgi:hypothetical protein